MRNFGKSKRELLPPPELCLQSFLLDWILPKALRGTALFRFPEAQRGKQGPQAPRWQGPQQHPAFSAPCPPASRMWPERGCPSCSQGEGTLLGNLGFTESASSNPHSPVSPEPSGDGGSPPASSSQAESGHTLSFPCRHRPPLPSWHAASGRCRGRPVYPPAPFLKMSACTTAPGQEPV